MASSQKRASFSTEIKVSSVMRKRSSKSNNNEDNNAKRIKVLVSEDQVQLKKMTSKQFEGWKVLLDDSSCGYIKFFPKNDEFFHEHVTVDFAIPKAKRGLHIGRIALQKAVIASAHTVFVAYLRKSNQASKKALTAVGFIDTKGYSKQLCLVYQKKEAEID
jgi:hypothetical protein